MESSLSRLHNSRNIVLCTLTTFVLFAISSLQVLDYLLADKFLPRDTQVGPISLELALVTTLVISLLAIPMGFAMMFFFGGVVSTRAMRLYLYVMRGKSVVVSKSADLQRVAQGRGVGLLLRRQIVYFAFILSVVISFAIYLSRHGVLPIVSPLTRTTDVISLITQDYIALTMSGALMVPVVALALPYFGGLRLRTIDAGPFHTTLLTFVIGASGGYTFVYSLLDRPNFTPLLYYLLLFMGVCWCFAFGCNLSADPANRQIVRDILAQKSASKLLSSKIWLESPPGKFFEI